jgi:NADH dehydrogenase
VSRRPKVLVVGAGFGGLAAVKALKDAPVDVTLVDANNFHTFQPLLYQVATAGLDVDDIAYPVRGIFRRQRNVTVRMARVTGVDIEARCVTVDRGGPLPYDFLVLAAGAVSADFGVPGVAEHAFALKSVGDASTLRAQVLDRFEAAAVDPGEVEAGGLDIVICGGGPSGVELAGAMQELYAKVLTRDFPSTEVSHAHIVLVEAADRLLGAFSQVSSDRALRTLTRRGVQVLLGVGVQAVDATGVTLTDGRTVPAHTVVWTAGVRANPIASMLSLPIGRGGRVVVGPDLSVPGHPELFVVGDMAEAGDGAGGQLAQVAQPAIQAGRHAGREIRRRLAGEPSRPFRYHDRGSMATIGRLDAVTELPFGLRLWGWLGWLSWLGLHLIELMGFRNRVNVLVNWAWNYVTYDRGARLLAEEHRPRSELS